MGIVTAPRSVSDATRFTATTPHASSKNAAAAATSSSGAARGSRFSRPGASSNPIGSAGAGGGQGGPSGGGRRPPPSSVGGRAETPEERVARLRAAHLKARNAEVSRFDKVVAGGRRWFDSMHKVTVVGLIGFTAVAGLVTAYTAYDMLTYNRKRKAEFIEAQMKIEADSLEAARLAYMTGKATEEQIALVEEVMAKEGGAGHAPKIFKMPQLISAPIPADRGSSSAPTTTQKVSEAATWPGSQTAEQQTQDTIKETKSNGGMWSWFSSSLKREEEGEDIGSSQERLGFESLSEEDDASGMRDSDLVRAIEDKQAYLRTKAKQAFEQEKENQRKGGPLDRIGLAEGEETQQQQPKKKSGWFW